jgi:hypothetical protein
MCKVVELIKSSPNTPFDKKLYCQLRSGYYMYQQVYRSQILRSAHTVYLYVFSGSQNKQRIFSYTALTDWFV